MRKEVKRIGGWGGGIRKVEVGIRDLVKNLNSLGYRTFSSCEGGPGHDYQGAYISFSPKLGKLTGEEIQEIKSLVEFHTDVPFRLVKQRYLGKESYHLLFEGPLKNGSWGLEGPSGGSSREGELLGELEEE